MSLFGGLFGSDGGKKPSSDLFSSASKFIAPPAPVPGASADGQPKLKSSGDAEASKEARGGKGNKKRKASETSKGGPEDKQSKHGHGVDAVVKNPKKGKLKEAAALAQAAAAAAVASAAGVDADAPAGDEVASAKANAKDKGKQAKTKGGKKGTGKTAEDGVQSKEGASKGKEKKKSKKQTGGQSAEADADGSQENAAVGVSGQGTSEEGAEEKKGKPKLTPEEEAEKLSRTIFVGGLAGNIQSKKLKKHFSSYGAVESVRLRSIPLDMEAKMPRRAAVLTKKIRADQGTANAYVVFKAKDSVEAALKANMTQLDDRHIRVDRATMPSKRDSWGAMSGPEGASAGQGVQYDPSRSVFIGNLHFLTQEEELINFFLDGGAEAPELKGSVEAVRLVKDKETNVGKGIAFVLFKTKTAARAALDMDGKELRKRPIRITRVSKSAPTPKARPAVVTGLGGRRGPGGKPGGAGKAGSKAAARSAPPSEWQGVQTKGKNKGVRGAKVGGGAQANSVTKTKSGSPAARPGGKRPAVMARKAASKGGGHASIKKVASGGVKKKQGAKAKPKKPQGKKPQGKKPQGKKPMGKKGKK